MLIRLIKIALIGSAIFLAVTISHAAELKNDPAGILLKPIKVAPNTYFVQGLAEIGASQNQNFISNAGFVITPKGIVVVDALGSPVLAQKLIQEIKKISAQKIVAVIVTHYHADHVYGLQEFKKIGAKIYGQSEGRGYISSETAKQRLITSRVDLAPWVNKDTHLVPADIWFDKQYQLNIGGLDFIISRVGPAHSPEDVLVYVPSEGVLFVGDLVFQGRIPYVGNADSKGWLLALDEFEKFNSKVIIPGHGPQSMNPIEDIRFTRDYLRFLRESMAPAALNMDAFDGAYSAVDWSEYDGIPLFKAANRMNAYNVYLSIQGE